MPKNIISAYRFDPAGPFVARREITISGVLYRCGDAVPTNAAPARRMRQFYEWKFITMADQAEAANIAPKDEAKKEKGKGKVKIKAEPELQPVIESSEGDADAAPMATGGFSMVDKGHGRYVIVDADGSPVSGNLKKAKAEEQLAVLNGAEG